MHILVGVMFSSDQYNSLVFFNMYVFSCRAKMNILRGSCNGASFQMDSLMYRKRVTLLFYFILLFLLFLYDVHICCVLAKEVDVNFGWCMLFYKYMYMYFYVYYMFIDESDSSYSKSLV